jgi:hypothetical protein
LSEELQAVRARLQGLTLMLNQVTAIWGMDEEPET